MVNQRLQEKIIKIRDYFKKNDIKYKKLSHNKEKIIIIFNDTDVEKFEEYFLNKDNDINYFYNNYRSYEMDYSIENNLVSIKYSKFGIIEIKNSSLNES